MKKELPVGKHLVFVGAGHAHLFALVRCREYINRGGRVTVINPSPYHYYSGMGPGMLSGIYRPQDIRFNIRKMAGDRGAIFIQDAVVAIDAGKRILRLKSRAEIAYDIASFNTGSAVPLNGLDADRENVFTVKPIINLMKAKERVTGSVLKKETDIIVVGGGPAGLEITCNVWRLVRDLGAKAHITLIAGQRLLEGLPERACRIAESSLDRRGIRLLSGIRADAMKNSTVRLSDGRTMPFDVCFLATGVRPSPLFKESGLPTGKSGGLLVNRYLQSVSHPELFGGGDCIDLEGRSLAKVGVYAVRENPVLFQNLLAALENGRMQEFFPQEKYMLIFNLGDGTGLLARGGFVWDGRLAFTLKDYIDRKFMRTFQLSGERGEEIERTAGGGL